MYCFNIHKILRIKQLNVNIQISDHKSYDIAFRQHMRYFFHANVCLVLLIILITHEIQTHLITPCVVPYCRVLRMGA